MCLLGGTFHIKQIGWVIQSELLWGTEQIKWLVLLSKIELELEWILLMAPISLNRHCICVRISVWLHMNKSYFMFWGLLSYSLLSCARGQHRCIKSSTDAALCSLWFKPAKSDACCLGEKPGWISSCSQFKEASNAQWVPTVHPASGRRPGNIYLQCQDRLIKHQNHS